MPHLVDVVLYSYFDILFVSDHFQFILIGTKSALKRCFFGAGMVPKADVLVLFSLLHVVFFMCLMLAFRAMDIN
jgi:hypothetical protein